MPDDTELLAVLESLRERGALGETSLPRAVAHADLFLAAVPSTCARLIDLGSGGGLPGLVLACRLTEVSIVLCDRRERRMDLLRLACTRLGLLDRVTVVTADVVALARRVDFRGKFDVVTARYAGLASLSNGALLAAMEGKFDVLVTTDRKLRYQQKLTKRSISIIVLRGNGNRIDDLLPS